MKLHNKTQRNITSFSSVILQTDVCQVHPVGRAEVWNKRQADLVPQITTAGTNTEAQGRISLLKVS